MLLNRVGDGEDPPQPATALVVMVVVVAAASAYMAVHQCSDSSSNRVVTNIIIGARWRAGGVACRCLAHHPTAEQRGACPCGLK